MSYTRNSPQSSISHEVVLLQGQALSEDVSKLEALARYYAEAKNADQLLYTIEEKLKRQRKLVQWWRANVRGKGNPKLIAAVRGQLTQGQAEQALRRSNQQISRWAEKLEEDADFDRELLDAQRRCVRICEGENIGTVRGTEGTGEFQLYTPAVYVEAAREVLGEIDLDPATCEQAQATVRAKHYYTKDAIENPWHGRVFLNPPYHRELLPQFVRKLVEEVACGNTTAAVMLTNNCTDTEWFAVAHAACQAMCFTTGRIRFTRPDDAHVLPTQGQAFFYFGTDKAKFRTVFREIGIGVQPYWQRRDVDGDQVSR